MITETDIKNALATVQDPELGQNIVELGMVRGLRIMDGKVVFTLVLTNLSCPFKDQLLNNSKEAVQNLEGIESVDVHLAEMTAKEKSRLNKGNKLKGKAEELNNVKRVIAVMSGKGGVGKSLVTSLLASSLRRMGHKVGILDADITGPSIPKMFFTNGTRLEFSPVAMLPAKTQTGILIMSINLLLEREDQPVVWRGPLISNVIRQFWSDVVWGDLDYLLVDLPPGTSDASLTVLQSLPMSGVLLVTSPQNLAGMVVRKAVQMVRHIEIPILGLLENMSYFECPDTGKQHEIFGSSNPKLMASQLNMPFLGRLPINPGIASMCDCGQIEQHPENLFRSISQLIADLTPAAQPPKIKKNES